jgi:hypothetical protein
MLNTPLPVDAPRAHCADPSLLPLVDAAAAKPGGPHGEWMKTRICPGCPVGDLCRTWAMEHTVKTGSGAA